MATALSLDQFWHSPARQLLAYPNGNESTLVDRWDELQTYGLEAIYSHGPKTLSSLRILGLGYCGVVLRVRHHGHDRVLKICRDPSPQSNLRREASMLIRANAIGVGPTHLAHSNNFLLMDHINGPTLADWLQDAPSVESIYRVVRNLIYQAYRLDQIGLDHGDLRCITSHSLIWSLAPVLIDFSGASLDRRPANVTTLVQGLFISTHLSQLLRPWFPHLRKASLIEHLRRYKQQPSLDQIRLLAIYLKLN